AQLREIGKHDRGRRRGRRTAAAFRLLRAAEQADRLARGEEVEAHARDHTDDEPDQRDRDQRDAVAAAHFPSFVPLRTSSTYRMRRSYRTDSSNECSPGSRLPRVFSNRMPRMSMTCLAAPRSRSTARVIGFGISPRWSSAWVLSPSTKVENVTGSSGIFGGAAPAAAAGGGVAAGDAGGSSGTSDR